MNEIDPEIAQVLREAKEAAAGRRQANGEKRAVSRLKGYLSEPITKRALYNKFEPRYRRALDAEILRLIVAGELNMEGTGKKSDPIILSLITSV